MRIFGFQHLGKGSRESQMLPQRFTKRRTDSIAISFGRVSGRATMICGSVLPTALAGGTAITSRIMVLLKASAPELFIPAMRIISVISGSELQKAFLYSMG